MAVAAGSEGWLWLVCRGPGYRFARAAIGAGWEELALLDTLLGLLLDGLLCGNGTS